MLKIENINIEYPTIGKEPTVGYEQIYKEYSMVSGKVRRIVVGKRLTASFSYALLNQTQRNAINQLLTIQKNQGYVYVEMDNPFGTFRGNALIDINTDQTRFMFSDVFNDYVWTNWKLNIKAVDLS